MNITTARQGLLEVLAPVLPGRVQPYPPNPRQRVVAPAVWIDQAIPDAAGTTMTVRLPVWIAADGAERAQLAAHDELVWAVWVAVRGLDPTPGIEWRTATVDVGGVTLTATVAELDVLLAVDTLCVDPSTEPVSIPPATLAG